MQPIEIYKRPGKAVVIRMVYFKRWLVTLVCYFSPPTFMLIPGHKTASRLSREPLKATNRYSSHFKARITYYQTLYPNNPEMVGNINFFHRITFLDKKPSFNMIPKCRLYSYQCGRQCSAKLRLFFSNMHCRPTKYLSK